jgi:predicted deacylase
VDPVHTLPPCGQPFQGDWRLASAEGIFCAAKGLNCRVAPDDAVAKILDCRGDVRQQFVSSSAGVVLGLRSKAYVRKGDWGVLIGSPLAFNQ